MSITYLSRPDNAFADLYLQVREKEHRIFTLSQVACLPDLDKNHIHHNEWQRRRKSADRFINYLHNKNRPLKILDVGCGNGWFSHLMSAVPNTEITGMDVNIPELQQACEVFQTPNLRFVYANIFEPGMFKGENFDIIVFNSCFQYFEDAAKLLDVSSEMLANKGEIHIIDTPFYHPRELEQARQRTRDYYEALGFPYMAKLYFHHNFNDLGKYRLLYKPSLFSKWWNDSPFCWISIDKR